MRSECHRDTLGIRMDSFYLTVVHRPELVPEYLQKGAEEGKAKKPKPEKPAKPKAEGPKEEAAPKAKAEPKS